MKRLEFFGALIAGFFAWIGRALARSPESGPPKPKDFLLYIPKRSAPFFEIVEMSPEDVMHVYIEGEGPVKKFTTDRANDRIRVSVIGYNWNQMQKRLHGSLGYAKLDHMFLEGRDAFDQCNFEVVVMSGVQQPQFAWHAYPQVRLTEKERKS